jgi:quercetin dioxygenase-like cupin family protein
MKVLHYEEVEQQPVHREDASGCQVRWLLGERDGAPNFALRQFEVAPGGYTPRHSHPYEHEVFVLEGQGVVVEGDREHAFGPGTVMLVKPDELHQFRNTGDRPLKFLCLIPNSAAQQPAAAPECGALGNASNRSEQK